MTNQALRMPPQNLDAEQSVIGGVLIDVKALARVLDIVQPSDFYRDGHRRIFGAMIEMFRAGTEIDLVTLTEELRRRKALDDVGGPAYITSLVDNVPTAANIRYYAEIVKRQANLRRIISACNQAGADAYDPKSDPHELVVNLMREIVSIETGRDKTVHIREPIKAEMERITTRFNDKDYRPGWRTGFESIDDELGGIQRGQLFVVAARPSVGKTAFLVGMVKALAKQTGILFFCLDQTKEEFARRMISRYSLVNNYAVRDGKLNKTDWPKITEAAADIGELPAVFINENTHMTIEEICFLTKKYVLEYGVGVVMIDYLQMVRRPGRASENEEIGEITWRLKELAKELSINVMLLSQLNRNIEKRPDPRPVLSDLRGSGSIEQDANVVVFLHWDEKYVNPVTHKFGQLEFIVAKHKDGRIGRICVQFDKPVYLMKESGSEFK